MESERRKKLVQGLTEIFVSEVLREGTYEKALSRAAKSLKRAFSAGSCAVFECRDGRFRAIVGRIGPGVRLAKKRRSEKVLVSPFVLGGRIIGSLVIAGGKGGFEKRDEELADCFSRQAALVMEHVRTLQRLRNEEKRYAALVENVPETVYSVRPDGSVCYISKDIVALTGCSTRDFFRNPRLFFGIIHREDGKRTAESFRKAVKKRMKFATRYRIVSKKGKIHYMFNRAVPVLENGKLVRFDGMMHDETPDVELLEKIREKNGRLIELVSERNELNGDLMRANHTLSEQRDELSESNRKLKSLEKLKDEFISMVSHELRAPLFPIRGYISSLKNNEMGPISEAQSHTLDIVERNVDRLSSLVEDVLLISKLDAGRLELMPEKMEAGAFVDAVCKDFSFRAAEKGLSLRHEVSGKIGFEGDRKRLTQVLSNFVGNAVKYTDIGSVTVRARKVKDMVMFDVKDTGPGVPPESLEHMFEKFYRVYATKKKEGSGLGLAISKAIVEAHCGSIFVRSSFGKGSTFCFTVPLKFRGKEAVSSHDLLAELPHAEREVAVGYDVGKSEGDK